MPRITIYSTGNCSYCTKAKQLLDELDIAYSEVRLDLDKRHHREFLRVTNGARTVPQVIIGDRCIGGFAELQALHTQGKLEDLVK